MVVVLGCFLGLCPLRTAGLYRSACLPLTTLWVCLSVPRLGWLMSSMPGWSLSLNLSPSPSGGFMSPALWWFGVGSRRLTSLCRPLLATFKLNWEKMEQNHVLSQPEGLLYERQPLQRTLCNSCTTGDNG